jgi:hypothetical protein
VWHLGVVLGNVVVGDESHYNAIRDSHDVLMKALRDNEVDDDDPAIIPTFSVPEVMIIVMNELEGYFANELANSVRKKCSLPIGHC